MAIHRNSKGSTVMGQKDEDAGLSPAQPFSTGSKIKALVRNTLPVQSIHFIYFRKGSKELTWMNKTIQRHRWNEVTPGITVRFIGVNGQAGAENMALLTEKEGQFGLRKIPVEGTQV